MNKTAVAFFLLITFTSCWNNKDKLSYNNTYEVADIDGIEHFFKLDKSEGQFHNLQLLDTNNRINFLKNRYRLYYDTIFRNPEVEIKEKQENNSHFCICSQKNDTILVSMISSYSPPLANVYEVEIFGDRFKSYQKTVYPGQNRLVRQTDNQYQKLQLLVKPKFNKNEVITGFLYFKTKKHNRQGHIFSGGVYFMCEISKENNYKPY